MDFTERESQVARLAILGLSNKDIAKELGTSSRTVEAHFNNLFNKAGVGSRTAVAFYWLITECQSKEDRVSLLKEFYDRHPTLKRNAQ